MPEDVTGRARRLGGEARAQGEGARKGAEPRRRGVSRGKNEAGEPEDVELIPVHVLAQPHVSADGKPPPQHKERSPSQSIAEDTFAEWKRHAHAHIPASLTAKLPPQSDVSETNEHQVKMDATMGQLVPSTRPVSGRDLATCPAG